MSLLAILTRVQPDGRLFVGERNDGELPTMTIGRVWRRARQAAFTAGVAASPLAKTPYDLRHAAVSTWLNGGVPPTMAEWAGHSVEVLVRIYAKCLDGGDALVRRWVEAALGHVDTTPRRMSLLRTSIADVCNATQSTRLSLVAGVRL